MLKVVVMSVFCLWLIVACRPKPSDSVAKIKNDPQIQHRYVGNWTAVRESMMLALDGTFEWRVTGDGEARQITNWGGWYIKDSELTLLATNTSEVSLGPNWQGVLVCKVISIDESELVVEPLHQGSNNVPTIHWKRG